MAKKTNIKWHSVKSNRYAILDNDTREEDDDDDDDDDEDDDDDMKLPMTAKKMTDKTTPKHTLITTENEVTVTKVTKPDTPPIHNDSNDGDDPDEDNETERIEQCKENPDEDKPMEMEQTMVDTTKKDQQQGKLDPLFDGTRKEQPGTPKWRNNRSNSNTKKLPTSKLNQKKVPNQWCPSPPRLSLTMPNRPNWQWE